MAKIKESDLFEPVKDWLEDRGWEVFAEVEYWSGRADIIGRHRPAIMAVELKTSLTMDLIEQAIRWRRFCHYIYIAIPARKTRIHSFVQKLLYENNIGILEVGRGIVNVRQTARYNRPQSVRALEWDSKLKPEHKTWLPGGSNGGGYVTEYKLTMKRVQAYLRSKKDWTPVSDIIRDCETHYKQPRSSMVAAMRKYEGDWAECKTIRGKLHFRVKP